MKQDRDYLVLQNGFDIFTMNVRQIDKCLSNEQEIQLIKTDENGNLYADEILTDDIFWDMVE